MKHVKRFTLKILWLNILVFLFAGMVSGQPAVHDPSHIVKDGGRYWIFCTGQGIWVYSASDSNFTNYQAEQHIFSGGVRPGWISGYVPGFDGNYWAPDIIYMNGKWHLYYSCSTFGSQVSAIGLTTTSSISDSAWEDQGMVVHSDQTWDVNAIDPAPFKDKDGKVWLLYGSYWDGIVMTELDSLTGKPIDPDSLVHLANNRCEASNMISHGDYYYLFFNRGSCCSGLNSTYYIQVGRSTSVIGPYYDKDSVMTYNNGGSVFLHSDGRYIGPGHFGYGEDRLTYHFYDGVANGASKLKVADLGWDDDWPVALYTRSYYLTDGNYVILNRNSKKALEPENGDTITGTRILQYSETGDTIQHWHFENIDKGYYRIWPVLDPEHTFEVAGCSSSNGALVQIGPYTDQGCEQWYLPYMGNGMYRIMSRQSFRAVEIANSSTEDGGIARQASYRSALNQMWLIKVPEHISAVKSPLDLQQRFIIRPNPNGGSFSIDLAPESQNYNIDLEIYTTDGRLAYSNNYRNEQTIDVTTPLKQGVYQIRISYDNKVLTQKLVVK